MGNNIASGSLFRRSLSGLLVAICCLIVGGTAMAQNKRAAKEKINFTDEKWADVLKLAKQKGQAIFVDAYASWCGPCKDLKAQTFTNAKVAAYFNAHFINVSLDMEKGEGVQFADQFAVDSYPTLLFIDDSGQILRKSEGFLDAGQLLELADKVKIKK
ncbi:MAG: thioredoxin domain protein [Mucilaginibacter sp.]|nr:thioredoxin domain protein [Mucilaginibacter sp.]